MTDRTRRRALALLLAAGAALGARAADTEPTPRPAATPVADPLGPARQAIKEGRWPAAIEALRKVDATGNADWNNLMGYAMRKQAPPDLDASQRYYDAALRIDPTHRGALEYSGELALMKGDLATAEQRLAALGRLCRSPCEPLDALKQAIARYRAGGRSGY